VVVLLLGIRLVRGRRRLVLFLRKFGLTEATAAVTLAIAVSIGRTWRLVTLDDSQTAPIGVARGGRRLSTATIVVTLLVVGASIWWLAGGGFENFVDNINVESTGDTAAQGFADSLGEAIGKALVVGLIAGLVFASVVLLATVAGVGTLFGLGTRRAVRRAEGSKSVVVTDERGVTAVTKKCIKGSQRVFGPRLVVARCSDAVWRQAVTALAGASAVVLVDVSNPTENLLWELRTLDDRGRPRVLIGQQARVADLDVRLAEILDGQEILAYGEGRRSLRRFAGALRSRLDDEDG